MTAHRGLNSGRPTSQAGATNGLGDRASGGLIPVLQESTPALIARQLRDAISSGVLAQGAQLVEQDLADSLRVSRGPLREAMQRLTQEGLLVSIRNRGLFVTKLSTDDVQDIYLARTAIEQAAAHALMDQRAALPQAIDTLRAKVDRLTTAPPDSAEATEADLDFHRELVALCGSPRLQRMHETLLAETRMCLNAMAVTYSHSGAHRADEHKDLVDAIERRDKRAFDRLLRTHAADALERLQ